ncbi:MAG: DUF3703 domain-containing protein [Parvibaculaceae bacterium]
MKQELLAMFRSEMNEARADYRAGALEQSFHHLERAHILGQQFLTKHLLTHWWMLKIGIRRSDGREVAGQIMRLFASVPGYLFGWVPKGNTGGANVSPIKPMPIPNEFAAVLADFNVARDVVIRMLFWIAAGTLAVLAMA